MNKLIRTDKIPNYPLKKVGWVNGQCVFSEEQGTVFIFLRSNMEWKWLIYIIDILAPLPQSYPGQIADCIIIYAHMSCRCRDMVKEWAKLGRYLIFHLILYSIFKLSGNQRLHLYFYTILSSLHVLCYVEFISD